MKQIGNYTIDPEPIGIGGMGKILRGRDPQGHVVAIKEISPEFANDLQIRYHIDKEVKILWEMDHPSIVKIYSSFCDESSGNYYIIMELIDGMNIEQYVNTHGPMEEDRAISIMVEILSAMQHVHNKGIIHRDIKPSNIMLRETGEVCLLDFGVAKDTHSSSKTIVGSIIGTDGYMSPEQADGFNIDQRSDIYALGCVLFFMLTGHHAYNTMGSEYETKEAILKQPFPKLSKYRKGLRELTQRVLDRATDKNMLRRYQTCSEFEAALRNGTKVGSTGITYESVSVSVGREMCDIIINDAEQKISRHHADVEMKEFTGGTYFIFTDSSANGSLVNGKRVHHQSVRISMNDQTPDIYLAGVADGHLDWANVVQILRQRAIASDNKEKGPNDNLPPLPPGRGGATPGARTDAHTPQTSGGNKKWIFIAFMGGLTIASIIAASIILILQNN